MDKQQSQATLIIMNYQDKNAKYIESEVRNLCGKEETDKISVTPLLQRIFENAQNNSGSSKQGYHHDLIVKKFGAALYCSVGKSGFDLLQTNLGSALPSLSTVQRLV